MALQTFSKQPDEVCDIDFDFGEWFAARSTVTPGVPDVTAETGLTVVSSALIGNVVKVIVSGGTNGTKYKLTVLLPTNTALVREADCYVNVKAL